MTFGIDYVPAPHIQAAYDYARNHKWYMDARLVTTKRPLCVRSRTSRSRLTSSPTLSGRPLQQPRRPRSRQHPVTHMWRTMINPDAPL